MGGDGYFLALRRFVWGAMFLHSCGGNVQLCSN